MEAVTLVLVCGDHKQYFDLRNRCVLSGLPSPLLVLANRASEVLLRDACPELEILRVQWSDEDRLLAEILALSRTRPVRAVSTANEALMELAGRVRAALGLPGLGPALVARFRNKLLMKQVLGAAGMRVPAHACCDQREAVDALLRRHGRLVLKPIDELGSRDVAFVCGMDELDAWYRNGTTTCRASRPRNSSTAPCTTSIPWCATASAYGQRRVPAGDGEHRFPPRHAARDRHGRGCRAGAAAGGVRAPGAGTASPGQRRLPSRMFPDRRRRDRPVRGGGAPAGAGIVQMIEAQHGIHLTRAQLLLDSGNGASLDVRAPRPELVGMMGFRTARGGTVRRIADGADFHEECDQHGLAGYRPGSMVRAARMSSETLGLLRQRRQPCPYSWSGAPAAVAFRRFTRARARIPARSTSQPLGGVERCNPPGLGPSDNICISTAREPACWAACRSRSSSWPTAPRPPRLVGAQHRGAPGALGSAGQHSQRRARPGPRAALVCHRHLQRGPDGSGGGTARQPGPVRHAAAAGGALPQQAADEGTGRHEPVCGCRSTRPATTRNGSRPCWPGTVTLVLKPIDRYGAAPRSASSPAPPNCTNWCRTGHPGRLRSRGVHRRHAASRECAGVRRPVLLTASVALYVRGWRTSTSAAARRSPA